MIICSDMEDRISHIERMESKFIDSGYKREELVEAKQKALALDRDKLMEPKEKSLLTLMECLLL